MLLVLPNILYEEWIKKKKMLIEGMNTIKQMHKEKTKAIQDGKDVEDDLISHEDAKFGF